MANFTAQNSTLSLIQGVLVLLLIIASYLIYQNIQLLERADIADVRSDLAMAVVNDATITSKLDQRKVVMTINEIQSNLNTKSTAK